MKRPISGNIGTRIVVIATALLIAFAPLLHTRSTLAAEQAGIRGKIEWIRFGVEFWCQIQVCLDPGGNPNHCCTVQ